MPENIDGARRMPNKAILRLCCVARIIHWVCQTMIQVASRLDERQPTKDCPQIIDGKTVRGKRDRYLEKYPPIRRQNDG
jgi:hypothetical protein